MATEKPTQNDTSTVVDQQTDSSASDENESKQMTRSSNKSQLDRSNAEPQQNLSQPQNQQPVQASGQETNKKSSAPSVNLDMDLDVEVELKAKIKGDLELSILSPRHDGLSVSPATPFMPAMSRQEAALRSQPPLLKLHTTKYKLPQDPILEGNITSQLTDLTTPPTHTLTPSEQATLLEKAVFPDQDGQPLTKQAISSRTESSSHGTPFSFHNDGTSPAASAPNNAHLAHLIAQLPPLDQATLLFDHFVATIYPTLCVLHIPSVRELLEKTYGSIADTEPKIEDLLMLFSIFAGAALSWTDELLRKLDATKENANSAFETYFHYAMSIVDDARRPLLPSTTAVVAVATLAHVAINSDDTFPFRALNIRNRCYLMCRVMMIHRLDGSTKCKERELTGANSIDLEIQRRVWWNMVASDWLGSFSGSSQEGVYTFIPRLMNVNQPCNVDDDQITASGPVVGSPPSVPTDMSFFFLRIKLAEICREIVDTLPPMLNDVHESDYNVILELDKKLQDLANSLPEFCRLDSESIERTKGICEKRPYIHWQRIGLHLGIHARLCRLHRPYHLEAYSNLAYSYSRTTSIQSAYRVLELRRLMDDAGAASNFRPERFWVILQHVTTAALTLAVDVSSHPEAPNTEALREKVLAAHETLNRSRKNAQSLIKGIGKNMEQIVGTLQKKRPNVVTGPLSTSEFTPSGASLEVAAPDGILIDANDMTMDDLQDGRGDEYSHQLWSDFLAAVPDLEEFEWTSLLQDLDFDPNHIN
ncbi:hypothetical protein FSARC_3287 [Fusarium sarcochroum]|uniref:Xylanolytic transcriptional activator regulatory domain-containing protein n=1 Tax=Fusarium sarcochroum TaxID=1208366 RepID=A0A8H4U434_9HYPO|nr:hypothetical protein FSARC_3287 [Fusarium sarcochroum]